MRWLLLKDLQILKRSPLLVGLLVVYPIAIGLMIGFASSSAPDKPRVAVLNQVVPGQGVFSLGGQKFDASRYADQLSDSVDPVPVRSRAEARRRVESGDVLAALIVPPDLPAKLASGLEQPTLTVLLNSASPLEQRTVDEIISARLSAVNQQLSREYTEVAADYIGILLRGGDSPFGELLGLQRSQEILQQTLRELPPDSEARAPLRQVIGFARLAIDNLGLSDDALRSVGTPLRVKRIDLAGATTPTDTFAVAIAVTVSLMFVTLGLAAGLLALEREEHAWGRLVRGLVSRTALLAEKTLLAAVCAAAVGLLLSVVIAAFFSLRWGRLPLWVLALLAGALAFAALGVAIGALAREVRAASLLAFLGSLPIAFLALVPESAVSGVVADLISVVSSLFPFKPALDAISSAFTGDGALLAPLLHLLALVAVFGALARVAVRRF